MRKFHVWRLAQKRLQPPIQADAGIFFHNLQFAADRTNAPHRMYDPILFGGVAANTDCHFAEAKGVQHVELARGEDKGQGRRHLERRHSRGLSPDPRHTKRLRQ